MDQNNSNQNTKKSTTYQTLGIISLILGILGFIFAFIPCLGMYAIFIAIPGLGCGIGAFVMAKKANAGIGLAVAGLVLSLLATGVASWQIIAVSEAVSVMDKSK
ncbi:MAG: hypothetical protein ACXVB0_02145 [Mucilaginibacter sp.]